jgi:low affinity Fe/Cu permease
LGRIFPFSAGSTPIITTPAPGNACCLAARARRLPTSCGGRNARPIPEIFSQRVRCRGLTGGVWAATGSYFRYSDTWQLVINTGTSIGTFLIVFLIQNTQNRDAKVMQLKLDELIRALTAARTELVQMEALSDEELDRLQSEFQRHRDQAATNSERIATSRQRRQSGKDV